MTSTSIDRTFAFISSSRVLATVAVALPLSLSLPAQEQGAAEEVIQLNPFEVSTARLDDYLPAEVTTGTRYAANALEIPFAVSIVTSEFIEDFQLHNFGEILGYTSGFAEDGGSQNGSFVLRGIRSISNFKNGVIGGFVFGPASVDRVEVVKGSNAAVYGQVEATGLVNTVTKQAKLDRAAYSASVGFGNNNWERWNLDANLPLIKDKFGIRIAAQYDTNDSKAQDFYRFSRKNFYATARYQIGPRTWLAGSVDYVKTDPLTANPAPFVREGNATVGIFGLGEYKDYYGFHPSGPASSNAVKGVYTSDLQLNHQFNDALSLRVYLNHEDRTQPQFRVQGGGNYFLDGSSAGRIGNDRRAFINYGDIGRKAAQVDLLGEFWTGKVEHKLLLAYNYINDYNDSYQRRRSALLPHLDPDDPVYYNFEQTYFVNDPEVFDLLQSLGGRDNTGHGFLVSERASFMEGRFIAMGGVRYDTIETILNNYLLPEEFQEATLDQNDTTYQAGVLYRVTNELSLYASYSESFQPQINTNQIDFEGNPLDPFRGSGFDAGIKGSLRGNTLNFTLGWFTVTRDNIGRAATDDAGNALENRFGAAYFVPGEQESQGVEFDYNLRLTHDLTVFGSYAYIDARWSKVPDQRHLPPELQLVGVTPARSPLHNAALGFRYALTSLGLKGVSVRAAARYADKAIIADNVRDANGKLFYAPDYILLDGGITYSFSSSESKVRHRFDATFRNLFDTEYLVGRQYGEKFGIMSTYTVSF